MEKKIVHITSVHVPFDTRIFEKMCKTALEHGAGAYLVAPHVCSETVDGVEINGVTVPETRILRVIFGTPKVVWAAWRIRGSIYHFHDPELIPWAQLFRLFGRRVIYDMHENVPKSILSKHWIPICLRRLVSVIWRRIERIFLWRVPVLFAESSYLDDYRWIEKCEVVLNMPKVASLLKINALKHIRPTVGYLGRVAPERGSLQTLKALEKLQEEGLEVDFLCIGLMSTEHRRELIEAAKLWSLEGLEIPGFMRSLKACSNIARCHAGLAVLAQLPNYMTSYPTKMFEYMALSIPVIVSDFPLYRSVVEQARCGICVDPNNVDELAQAIRWIVQHPEEAQVMGKNGRIAVQKRYSWEHEACKLWCFYRRVAFV